MAGELEDSDSTAFEANVKSTDYDVALEFALALVSAFTDADVARDGFRDTLNGVWKLLERSGFQATDGEGDPIVLAAIKWARAQLAETLTESR